VPTLLQEEKGDSATIVSACLPNGSVNLPVLGGRKEEACLGMPAMPAHLSAGGPACLHICLFYGKEGGGMPATCLLPPACLPGRRKRAGGEGGGGLSATWLEEGGGRPAACFCRKEGLSSPGFCYSLPCWEGYTGLACSAVLGLPAATMPLACCLPVMVLLPVSPLPARQGPISCSDSGSDLFIPAAIHYTCQSWKRLLHLPAMGGGSVGGACLP